MLAIWNRRELVTVLTMQEQSDILSALRDAGLDYAVKVIDRSSPSVLNPGTRADFGTMGMSPGAQYEYIIYVNKRDYDAARDAAGAAQAGRGVERDRRASCETSCADQVCTSGVGDAQVDRPRRRGRDRSGRSPARPAEGHAGAAEAVKQTEK